jgi:hypothetical protein
MNIVPRQTKRALMTRTSPMILYRVKAAYQLFSGALNLPNADIFASYSLLQFPSDIKISRVSVSRCLHSSFIHV